MNRLFLQNADGLKRAFASALDEAERQRRPIKFWWRDDDAIEPTPQLEKLLNIRETAQKPLHLAVIPALLKPQLAPALPDEEVTVLQHGFAHKNHEPQGALKSEFGPHRKAGLAGANLQKGRAILQEAFGAQFFHAFVPPWNRMTDSLKPLLIQNDLQGYSGYRRRKLGESHVCNTHLDVIGWRFGRRFIGRKRAYRRLLAEVLRRCQGHNEPLGILTHHLVHSDDVNDFLLELFQLLKSHKGACWPKPGQLFHL